jgi:hypothetical protein
MRAVYSLRVRIAMIGAPATAIRRPGPSLKRLSARARSC